MSVINPATNAVTATIGVGNDPYGVAVSPTGPEAGDVFVANLNDDTVSVINPATDTVSTIPVGSEPPGVAASPTGPEAGTIYVTNYGSGTVSVIG